MLRHLSQRQRNVLLVSYFVLGTLAWALVDTWGLVGAAVATVLAAKLLDLRSRDKTSGSSPSD